jgi:hypothetical protein
MSELNNELKKNKNVSAYQQLSSILNSLKSEEISLNDAMNKIQLKDVSPTRPFCKVTSYGSLALYGISKQPIILYADQWDKLIKVTKSNYIENYIKYNETKLKFRPKNNTNFTKTSRLNENTIIFDSVEHVK